MTSPADIANRALDAIGYNEEPIGDLQEGTRASRIAVRHYNPTRQQLLRAAHWNFARKTVTMILVADATANQPVISPWLYEYLLPTDALQVRFVPNLPSAWVQFQTSSSTAITAGVFTVTPDAMTGTLNDQQWQIVAGTNLTINDGVNTESVTVISTTATTFTATFLYNHAAPYTINGTTLANNSGLSVPNIPLVGNALTSPMNGSGWAPAPFVVANDMVVAEWGQALFNAGLSYGIGSPVTVVLTNVRSAQLVYTADILSPDEWDVSFEECLVAALAARMAMGVIEDKKLAMAVMGQQVGVAKMALTEARRQNANEGVTTINRDASWTRARYVWGASSRDAGGACNGVPWASFGFADGSTL